MATKIHRAVGGQRWTADRTVSADALPPGL